MSSLSKNDSASGANAKTPPGSPFPELIMNPCGGLDGPNGTKRGPPSPATRTRLAEKERDEAKAENAFLREEIVELLLKNKRLCKELTNSRTTAGANATADLALLQEEDKEPKRLLKEKKMKDSSANSKTQIVLLQEEKLLMDETEEANSRASAIATTTRRASAEADDDLLVAWQHLAKMEKMMKQLDAGLSKIYCKKMFLTGTSLVKEVISGPLLAVLESDFLDFLEEVEDGIKFNLLHEAIKEFKGKVTVMFMTGPKELKAKDELMAVIEKEVLAFLEELEAKTKEKLLYDAIQVFTTKNMKTLLAGPLKDKEGEFLEAFELLKAKVVATHLKHKVKAEPGADVEELDDKQMKTQLGADADAEALGA